MLKKTYSKTSLLVNSHYFCSKLVSVKSIFFKLSSIYLFSPKLFEMFIKIYLIKLCIY